ncbi:MAG: hypothetical protein IPL53_17775 [Ignavibacteria bacterium]|nr:hypothetical protein [Ignavibacteria bacterium]
MEKKHTKKYFFFDVNALVRIYFEDIGSSNLLHIYHNPEYKILTIEFALLEAISALNKSTRDNTVDLKIDQVQIILEQINSDVENEKIHILNSSKYMTDSKTFALMQNINPFRILLLTLLMFYISPHVLIYLNH